MGAFAPRNVIAAYDAGALDLMLKLVDSSVAGERAAAATTLRNICVEDEKYRESFVKLGGIQALVNQLDTKPDPSLNHADVQLEAVLNLQDMVETEDGQTIAEYAKLAVKAGAIPKLQQLEKSDDEEVRFTIFTLANTFIFYHFIYLYLFIYLFCFLCCFPFARLLRSCAFWRLWPLLVVVRTSMIYFEPIVFASSCSYEVQQGRPRA